MSTDDPDDDSIIGTQKSPGYSSEREREKEERAGRRKTVSTNVPGNRGTKASRTCGSEREG